MEDRIQKLESLLHSVLQRDQPLPSSHVNQFGTVPPPSHTGVPRFPHPSSTDYKLGSNNASSMTSVSNRYDYAGTPSVPTPPSIPAAPYSGLMNNASNESFAIQQLRQTVLELESRLQDKDAVAAGLQTQIGKLTQEIGEARLKLRQLILAQRNSTGIQEKVSRIVRGDEDAWLEVEMLRACFMRQKLRKECGISGCKAAVKEEQDEDGVVIKRSVLSTSATGIRNARTMSGTTAASSIVLAHSNHGSSSASHRARNSGFASSGGKRERDYYDYKRTLSSREVSDNENNEESEDEKSRFNIVPSPGASSSLRTPKKSNAASLKGKRRTPRTPSQTGAEKQLRQQQQRGATLPLPTVIDTTVVSPQLKVPPPPTRPAAIPYPVDYSTSYHRSRRGTGETRSPSPLNPRRSTVPLHRFVLSGLSAEEEEALRKAVSALGQGGVILSCGHDDIPPMSFTHVVIPKGQPRNFKALCGVVCGKWLLHPDYIYDSLQVGFWVDERDYPHFLFLPPPLAHTTFMLTKDPNAHNTEEAAAMQQRLECLVRLGEGVVVSSRQAHEEDVVVLSSGMDLLQYCIHVQASRNKME